MWQQAGWARKRAAGFTDMTSNGVGTLTLLEKHGRGVCVLKINRPQALNALNSALLRELREVLTTISRDPEVRALVLTGEGEKAFIAGADIVEMKDKSPGEAVEFSQLGHEVARLLEAMPKPTIAAVNGFALGGGTEMAIACDFIYASENAVFGQPEVGLGIIPGFGGTFRLPRFVGYPRAKELIFSGRKVKAPEAKEIGLANAVYPLVDLLPKAIEMAQMMADASATAVQKAKELINEFSGAVGGGTNKVDAEAHAFGMLMGSHDQREGMGAFVEKRKPKFQGL